MAATKVGIEARKRVVLPAQSGTGRSAGRHASAQQCRKVIHICPDGTPELATMLSRSHTALPSRQAIQLGGLMTGAKWPE
jgi:hypothetical protein